MPEKNTGGRACRCHQRVTVPTEEGHYWYCSQSAVGVYEVYRLGRRGLSAGVPYPLPVSEMHGDWYGPLCRPGEGCRAVRERKPCDKWVNDSDPREDFYSLTVAGGLMACAMRSEGEQRWSWTVEDPTTDRVVHNKADTLEAAQLAAEDALWAVKCEIETTIGRTV